MSSWTGITAECGAMGLCHLRPGHEGSHETTVDRALDAYGNVWNPVALGRAAALVVDEWDRTIADGGLVTIALQGPVDALRAALAEEPAEHQAHHGNHVGYACGLSGPHCWACNEPWPCRTARTTP